MATISSCLTSQHDQDSGTNWKQSLREAVSDPYTLLEMLDLQHLATCIDAHNTFPLRVPQSYIAKIKSGNATDPLLLQILPTLNENHDDGLLDPVADLSFMPSEGLLHKYHGRALMITTGACAIHCRYCFRRHYPYAEASVSNKQLDASLRYLQQHEEIDEIILSGGDPLVLDDARLAQLINKLATVTHLRYLRIHTRLPVVLPERITPSLIELLNSTALRVSMVIHCNHANEIDHAEEKALWQLQQSGITLLNQSVLLKGVNDTAETLIALSKRLYDNRVLPYYLHLLDPVRGAMHFDVSARLASDLIETLRAKLPGYLVPKLVREVPNSTSKSAILAF